MKILTKNFIRSTVFSLVFSVFLLASKVAYAAPGSLKDVITKATDIILLFVPVVIGLALLFFFWGVAQFILHADNEQKRSEARQILYWGVIILFVALSVWGIVRLVQNTFGFDI